MNNIVYRIVPDSLKHDIDIIDLTRINFSYLHGQLHDDAQYDIFFLKGKDIILTEGIHKAIYAGKKCTIFLWNHYLPNQLHGLAVYDDDIEAYNYAHKCYETKARHI